MSDPLEGVINMLSFARKSSPAGFKLLAQNVAEVGCLFGLAYLLLHASPIQVASILTSGTSIAFKVIGLPDQVLRLLRTKSSRGMSYLYHGVATVSYLSWAAYGWRTHDMVILLSQGWGIPGSFIIFHLVLRYRLIERTSVSKAGLQMSRQGWIYSQHGAEHVQIYDLCSGAHAAMAGFRSEDTNSRNPTHITRVSRAPEGGLIVDVNGFGNIGYYAVLDGNLGSDVYAFDPQ